MKKLIGILLSVLCVFGCLSVGVAAEEENPVGTVYYIAVHPDAASNGYVIVPLNEEGKYNSNYTNEDDDIVNGSFYVKPGGVFRFVVEYSNNVAPNDITTVKCIGTKEMYAGSQTGDPMLDENLAVILEPDSNGVYTINNVQKDMTVTVYNVETKSISSIIDFVKRLIAFMADLMSKFFGLDIDFGEDYKG